MSGKQRAMVVGALLSCVSLVTAAPAVADPIAYADFVAARDSAVAASGVFTPGTTMVVDLVVGTGEVLRIATNPDGSMTWLEQSDDGVYRVRCVRVDRCWEQSDIDFHDTKWHRLPPDSVTYRQASAGWQRVSDLDWSAAALFETGTALDASPTYTARETEEGVTVTEVVTVRPMKVTEVVTVAKDGEELMVRELTMAAQAQPVPVQPPARRFVGKPVPWLSTWTAEINR
jgi:hypothetical protein